MIYYVDIDNTICHTKGNDYRNATPYPVVIAMINELFEQGEKVVYWTARGGTSGTDWYDFTLRQLKSWGCNFDELRTDKPSFDVLIDDRSRKTNEI